MFAEQSMKANPIQRAVDAVKSNEEAYLGCVVTVVELEGGHVRLNVQKPTSREGKPVLVLVQERLTTTT